MNLFSSLISSLKGVPEFQRRCCAFCGWSGTCLVLLAVLLMLLSSAPRVIADDINADADVPDFGAVADYSPSNPVLEIPQQCDQDAVAVLCDRSADESTSSADDNPTNDENIGSPYDYANQNITSEASAPGTMNVPLGIYAPGYVALSPAPTVVSSGPGSYQQWASGPGSYQQFAPGPGYIQPPPLGYRPYGLGSSFGPRSFGGFGGGHFGRR